MKVLHTADIHLRKTWGQASQVHIFQVNLVLY